MAGHHYDLYGSQICALHIAHLGVGDGLEVCEHWREEIEIKNIFVFSRKLKSCMDQITNALPDAACDLKRTAKMEPAAKKTYMELVDWLLPRMRGQSWCGRLRDLLGIKRFYTKMFVLNTSGVVPEVAFLEWCFGAIFFVLLEYKC